MSEQNEEEGKVVNLVVEDIVTPSGQEFIPDEKEEMKEEVENGESIE